MFKTQEELEEYLRGDPSSIQCLICKKQYRHLNNNISSKHEISVILITMGWGARFPCTLGWSVEIILDWTEQVK